jgi:hypothetical protein
MHQLESRCKNVLIITHLRGSFSFLFNFLFYFRREKKLHLSTKIPFASYSYNLNLCKIMHPLFSYIPDVWNKESFRTIYKVFCSTVSTLYFYINIVLNITSVEDIAFLFVYFIDLFTDDIP